MNDFEQFWQSYPRKVGKFKAIDAYRHARVVSSADDILAGVLRYRQHLPDEMRFVPMPATWLNQGRWFDEYEPLVRDAAPREDRSTCAHDPRCGSNEWHALMLAKERAS